MAEEQSSNSSNASGWVCSRDMKCPADVDIPRNTNQCFLLIIHDTTESPYGKFRNTMILTNPIFHAYGHGEFYALSKCLRTIEGCFPANHAIGVVSFDDFNQAVKCCETRTEMREQNWLGGVEMYIVPLCNPARHIADYPFLQMDVYDVKNGKNFVRYLNSVEELAHQKGGIIIAGTTQSGRWRGIRKPCFILLSQWVCADQAEEYNKDLTPILRESGSSCSSRIIFEMTLSGIRCFN